MKCSHFNERNLNSKWLVNQQLPNAVLEKSENGTKSIIGGDNRHVGFDLSVQLCMMKRIYP